MELRKDMFELNGKKYFKFNDEDELYDSYQDEYEEDQMPTKESMLLNRIEWHESMQRLLKMSWKENDKFRNDNEIRR